MKHTIVPLCLAFAGACVSASFAAMGQAAGIQADTTVLVPSPTHQVSYQTQPILLPVKPEDVPDKLRRALENEGFKEWQQGDILQSQDGQMFEFRIGAGDEQAVYRFTPHGNRLKVN